MRAVVFREFGGTVAVEDVPEPACDPDGVLIRVEATGLCRSDWHGWMGHDDTIRLPHVPGHELAGTVEAVGRDVRRWHAGDRVTVPFVCACGHCTSCLAGDEQVCDDQRQPGFTDWGSFAEVVAIARADRNLVRLPDALGAVVAASLGCRFATAYRAVLAQGQLRAGEWVAVHGCGGVGLSAVMIAVAEGARVVAIDTSSEALAAARALGAEVLLDGSLRDLPGAIVEVTDGGAHLSIDALGERRHLPWLGGVAAQAWTARAGRADARRRRASRRPDGPGDRARAGDPGQPRDGRPGIPRNARAHRRWLAGARAARRTNDRPGRGAGGPHGDGSAAPGRRHHGHPAPGRRGESWRVGMRALVKTAPGPGGLELLDVPEPTAGPGEVLLAVRAAALCGTDVHIAHGTLAVPTPLILGHELAGTVAAVGSGVTRVRPGQRVTTETDAFVCGTCAHCRAGDHHLCPSRTAIGTSAPGGFAELVAVPAAGVHVLPAGLGFVAGALTEPLAVACRAVVERAAVAEGEDVVVIGPGTIGLLVAQVAAACGAKVTVAGLARHARRLTVARRVGVEHIVALDVPAERRALASGRDGLGVATVFECSGAPDAATTGLGLLRKGGRLVAVGFSGGRVVQLDMDSVVNRELALVASRGKRPSSFAIALDLLRRRQVALRPLVTHRLPLDRWPEAFDIAGRPGTKVVLEIGDGHSEAAPAGPEHRS